MDGKMAGKRRFTLIFNLMAKLFILSAILTLAGCIYLSEPEFVSNTPEYYATGYDSVWRAAVDSLDEIGFVIVQMDKPGGYIATDRMEKDGYRTRVRLRFSERDGIVRVDISSSSEFLSEVDGIPKWKDLPTHGHVMQDKIKRKMKFKLQPYKVGTPMVESIR